MIDQSFRSTAAWRRLKGMVKAEEDTCGLCGKFVDTTLGKGFNWSPEVDHIIPVEKGGHPLDRRNLVLMHMICNRRKGKSILTQGLKDELSKVANEERYRGSTEDWNDILGG